MTSRAGWFSILVCLLGACGAPDTRRPELAARLETEFARAKTTHGDLSVTSDGWIAALADPELEQLIAEALRANADIAGVEADVRRSRALAKSARARLEPRIDLELGANGEGRIDESGERSGLLSAAVAASWEPDLFGRLRHRSSSEASSARASATDLAAARRVLAASVAEAYFLAIEARRAMEVSRRTTALLQETLGYIETQFERGLRSGRDRALIRADAHSAAASLIQAELGTRDAIRSLQVLLGRFPSGELALGEGPSSIPEPQGALPASLLEARPDIEAAAHRVSSARSAKAGTEAERLARVGLTGSIAATTTSVAEPFDAAAAVWRLGVNVTLPLFDGGERRANVEAASASVDEAVGRYNSVALAAFREVEEQLDLGKSLQLQEARLRAAHAAADEALRFARYRYESGDSDLLDVLSIQQRASSAERQIVAIERARLVQYVALALATGGI